MDLAHESAPLAHSAANVDPGVYFLALGLLLIVGVGVSVYRYLMEDDGAYFQERAIVVVKISLLIKVIVTILRLIFLGM